MKRHIQTPFFTYIGSAAWLFIFSTYRFIVDMYNIAFQSVFRVLILADLYNKFIAFFGTIIFVKRCTCMQV